MSAPSDRSVTTPLLFTMQGRCPQCGKGHLYRGMLSLHDRCSNCDLDFKPFDQGDGPAPFAIFIVGGLVVLGMFLLETTVAPPVWVHGVIWIPLIFVLSIVSLRLLKSWLVAEQFRNDAEEGKLSD